MLPLIDTHLFKEKYTSSSISHVFFSLSFICIGQKYSQIHIFITINNPPPHSTKNDKDYPLELLVI